MSKVISGGFLLNLGAVLSAWQAEAVQLSYIVRKNDWRKKAPLWEIKVIPPSLPTVFQ